ncbi:MAG: hypothetical protein R3B06_00725 [Kofleriaceae bacterium]
MQRLAVLFAVLAVACGGDDGGPAGVDAAGPDALTDGPSLDAAVDAPPIDGAPAVPVPGFGAIAGQCGVLTLAELDGTTPLWFQGDLTFDNSYDDPAERDQLTPGGQHIVSIPNAGGSSVLSEVFAYEWLARCELADLIKTETEVVYDVDSKKVDLTVDIDGRVVGVSVTRAMTFPIGAPYTLAAATTLLDRKLDDIQLATAAVSAADRWTKQMLVVLAIDPQHAQVAMEAWNALDAPTKDDTILIVAVTNGDDLFIYTNG